MTSTDELTTSLSLRCEEMLAASPSTSNVIRKDYRRRSDRHPFQQTTNNIQKRLCHCPQPSRKRTSDDTRLNSAIHPSVRSHPDRALQRDVRVLENLKRAETNRRTNATYFMSVQTELKVEHREEIVQWLIEVSQSNHCDADVLPLAVSIMDRFLSLRTVPLCQLQLVGGVCLFIASKLKAPSPLNTNTIVYYSDKAFSYDEVLPMEMLILQALDWDVAAPTAFDFFDQITGRMAPLRALQPSFTEIVYGILKNYKLAMLLPSVQCGLALLSAARRNEDLYYRMAVCPMLPETLGCDLNLMLGLLPQVERTMGQEEPKLSGIAAPPCSNRTPSPTFQALKAPLLSTPINDSGFNSGASSPESACKKEAMECTPPKVSRT